MTANKWRLYREQDRSYCGEYDTLAEAQEALEQSPRGLPEVHWQTFRAAGGMRACEAPSGDGMEDLDTLVDLDGDYYAIRVTYREDKDAQ